MKILVVYYSFEGNSKYIAELIKTYMNADILELKLVEELKSKGFLKYFWGGKQVLSNQKPKLQNIDKNLDDYDLIFIGTPVWAWSFSPALNTFFAENKITDKKIALFCCSGGGKGKTFEKMKAELKGNEIVGEMEFIDPLKKKKIDHNKQMMEWVDGITEII